MQAISIVRHAADAAATPRRKLTGRLVVPAHDCWCPPAVHSDDLIDVDFDRNEVTSDGLYLVEVLGTDRVDWRGCRRFSKTPTGLQMDLTGSGNWTRLPGSLSANGIRIVGRIERVYRPQ